jgi:hypothetical protein
MELRDDDLTNFERHGAEPLPATNDQGYVDHEGARIWYATFGAGHSVIMLHGGLGHSATLPRCSHTPSPSLSRRH